MTAREAVQTAEDARLIAVKRVEEERLAKERQAAQEKVDAARLQAEKEAAERAAAERAKAAAESAKQEADRNRLAAEEAKRAAERERLAADQAKLAAERARQEAEAAARQAEAERARALTEQQAALAEAEKAKQRAADAEQERAKLREELRQQLNLVLETRDSARGLIVNVSDVLFDTAKYTLKPGAREKLARVAGILLTQPSLRIEVEGHTDSVGSDEYNQRLSENRASSVRDYLVSQGVKSEMIAARGFGEGRPVASNDNAAGRQQNRRVELVVSGEAIGQPITSSRR
jgi:outer membrane protein OmpA-like peptidoglycan-associated protein